MDYQGNYFDEERDENESKIYRTVKGIFKWTMYGISFIIYAFIIYMMIANRDSKILKKNYMLEDYSLSNEPIIYRINTKLFMNDDGSMQVYNIDYSPEHQLIEIGVKFNAKKLTYSQYDDCLIYVLTDQNGKHYELTNIVTDKGGRYGFARMTFKDITIDLNSNDLRYSPFLNASIKPAFDASNGFERTNNELYLTVYKKSDNELLHEFKIYDNSVTFNTSDYND